MRFLQDHTEINIRMLFTKQLDESPVFRIEVALDFKHYPVSKNKVRCVTAWDDDVVLVLFVLLLHPVGS